MEEKTEKTLHFKITELIERWLPLHSDEKFDLDLLCRQLEITDREARIEASKILSNLYRVKHTLDKEDKYYRYINTSVKELDWVNAKIDDKIEIAWPYGISDDTHFGFDGHLLIPQRSIIVAAGVSNMGKTTLALNFLWMNMDKFKCTLMGNEYEPSQFRRRAANMVFRNPVNEDGKSKFELIERNDNWKDIIRPNNINIIDWLNLGDNFYALGKVIEGIKSSLDKGIAFICIQKDAQKERGMGGMWGEHLATLYLTLDYGRLTVTKAKEWNGHNPNREMYGFEIVNHGAEFANIRSVSFCRKCYGKTGNSKCELCSGTGYVDAENNSCWISKPQQANFTEPVQEPF